MSPINAAAIAAIISSIIRKSLNCPINFVIGPGFSSSISSFFP